MKAEIINLTPEVAKKILEGNTANRKLKISYVWMSNQMRNGEWKENGEAIIVDKNGIVKDGQHRLHAVIASRHSYNVPLITDVDPDVMDTIDTGVNRGLNDILELNGFNYSNTIASLVRSIMLYDFRKFNFRSGSKTDTNNYVSNKRGYAFARNHKNQLQRLAKVSSSIGSKQPFNVLTNTEIGLFIYVIGGFEFENIHQNFIKRICGIDSIEGTAAYWLFKKMLSAKKDKITINKKWKLHGLVKAWNMFVGGDIPVNRMVININNDLDKVLKI